MRRTRRKKKTKKAGGCLFLFICMMIVVGLGIKKYMPNFQVVSIYKMIPAFHENEIGVVIGNQPIEMQYSPQVIGEELLFPFDFVKEYIDPHIFWDEKAEKLTITTENKVVRMKTDDLTYYVNHQPLTLQMPIQKFDDIPYVPFSFLQNWFDIEASYQSESNIIIMDYKTDQKKVGRVTKNKTDIRHQPNIKSPILEKMMAGEEVVVFEETDNWMQIRSQSGIVGYIRKKEIGEIKEIALEPQVKEENEPSWKPIEGKINLVWDQVFTMDSNRKTGNYPSMEGLDVISPTWFEIANEKGDIKNIADKQYVQWAHKQGYQVWALFNNPFGDKNITHGALSSTDSRENMIKQLLAFAALYDLDGINIDFESIPKEDGIYYVQFIRELTPFLKEQGLVVSVDMYVPSGWTRHYNRAEVGKVVDYMMVMAYDEHWSTSPESGSVASIGWVERGIKETLKEVPANKVLLGLPYYTRVWQERNKDGDMKVTSKAYGMESAAGILKQNGVEPKWDETTGQYYGEYKKNDGIFKVWLEEERSIEEKVKLVEQYNLAGVAGWKRGLEKPEVWEVLDQYLEK